MKTEQQLRFEAANNAAFPTGKFFYDLNGVGDYASQYIEDRYIGFQLGEASGLAMAAAECEKRAAEHMEFAETEEEWASRNCAEAIRALTQESSNEH